MSKIQFPKKSIKTIKKFPCMQSLQTVYQDNTVLITDYYIKIYKYYFPLATSKTILSDEIQQIVFKPHEKTDVWWGSDSKHLNNWFPFDTERKAKKGYFEIILKNSSLKPSFSPIDVQKAYEVMWINFSSQGRQYKFELMRRAYELQAELDFNRSKENPNKTDEKLASSTLTGQKQHKNTNHPLTKGDSNILQDISNKLTVNLPDLQKNNRQKYLDFNEEDKQRDEEQFIEENQFQMLN